MKWIRFRAKVLGRCCHRTHRWINVRTCWRPWTYDGFCAKHNRTCFTGCKSS